MNSRRVASYAYTDRNCDIADQLNPEYKDNRSKHDRNEVSNAQIGRGDKTSNAGSCQHDDCQPKSAAVCVGGTHNYLDECLKDGSVKLACGRELKMVTGACDAHKIRQLGSDMPVLKGRMGSVCVDTLRDTGCSGVVVKKCLVQPELLMGKSHLCFLIDGTVRNFPIAKINVCTPYFVGEVEAMCMENPVYELIIGNVPGARDPNDPDMKLICLEPDTRGPMS
jgi:hypothetical protein